MVQSIIALGFLLATLIVGVFFAYVYSLKRQSYLLFWTAAWVLYALHYLSPAVSLWIGTNAFFGSLNHVLIGFAGICFFLGTQLYTSQKLWLVPAIVAAALLVGWSAANSLGVFSLSAFLPASVIYIAVAFLFWRESQHHETLADRLLGVAFAAWGALFLAIHLLHVTPETLDQAIRPISAIPTALVSMLLVMAIYEEEKRRVER